LRILLKFKYSGDNKCSGNDYVNTKGVNDDGGGY